MTINRDLADLAQSLAGGIDVADGGTGATTASAARAALSAQTENAALTALASVMSSTATAAAQRAALGLDTGNTPDFTGITIGGGGDTLDYFDYGTWTPTAVAGTTNIVVSSSGYYIRIGDFVHCSATVTMNRGTNTGILTIGGLPFTPNSSENHGAVSLIGFDNTDLYMSGHLAGMIPSGTGNLNCYAQSNASDWALNGLFVQNFLRASSNAPLIMNFQYRVA